MATFMPAFVESIYLNESIDQSFHRLGKPHFYTDFLYCMIMIIDPYTLSLGIEIYFNPFMDTVPRSKL